MPDYVIYRTADGAITHAGSVADIAWIEARPRPPDTAVLAAPAPADPSECYVDLTTVPPMVRPRPVLPDFDRTAIAADGVDTATLSGLPADAIVCVDGVAQAVAGGTLEIVAAWPGAYVVEVEAFPYLPLKRTVVAT